MNPLPPKRDRLLALLLLLPGVVLAWPGPGAPLLGDPFPHASGFGWAAILLIPAALVAAFLGWKGRGPVWLTVLAILAANLALVADETDALEARRALLAGLVAFVSFAVGARLDKTGRGVLVGGVVMLALVWLLVALIGGAREGWAGVLGNSGTLSQAALPGAVVGVGVALSGQRLRWLALVPTVAFVLHAGLTPVFGGAVALGVSLLLMTGGLITADQRRRLVAILVGGIALFAGLRLTVGSSDGGIPVETASQETPASSSAEEASNGSTDETEASAGGGDLGGVGVRLAIWRALPDLYATSPWLGIGLGQFRAAFPPFRDPVEIESSRHGACNETDSVVSHPHNDWLLIFVECGAFVGVGWVLMGLLALGATVRALRQGLDSGALCAIGALSVFLNAFFHAPFSHNAASNTLAFGLLGAALASVPGLAQRTLAAVKAPAGGSLGIFFFGLLAIAQGLLGWKLVAHGWSLREAVGAFQAIDMQMMRADPTTEGLAESAEVAEKALNRALQTFPDSAAALTLAARTRRAEGAAGQLDWSRVLEQRPFDTEALERMGLLAIQSGDYEGARERWGQVLQLLSFHPRIVRNLARLELYDGELDTGIAYIGRLQGRGCMSDVWAIDLACDLATRGLFEASAAVFGCLDERLASGLPDMFHAVAQEREQRGLIGRATRALRLLAHTFWAREQAAADDFDTALRSYRQALRQMKKTIELLQAEAGACALRTGAEEEAEELLQRAALGPVWETLPPWAQHTLEAAGRRP